MKLSYKLLVFLIIASLSVSFVLASTAISRCHTITSAGHYHLNANLRNESTCISINSNHVNLNGMRGTYSIVGNNTYDGSTHGTGIDTVLTSGYVNITIRNFEIKNFSRGIYTMNARNWTVYNNTIVSVAPGGGLDSSLSQGKRKMGVFFAHSTGINISSNTIISNGSVGPIDIYLQNVTNNMRKGESGGFTQNYVEFNNLTSYGNGSQANLMLDISSHITARGNKLLAFGGKDGVIQIFSGSNHSHFEHNNISVRGYLHRSVRGVPVNRQECISVTTQASYNRFEFNNCTTDGRGIDTANNILSSVVFAAAHYNNFSHNILNATGENVTIFKIFNSNYNRVEGNTFHAQNGTYSGALLVMAYFGAADNNTFVNTTIIRAGLPSPGFSVVNFDPGYTNYFTYETTYGKINWTSGNWSTYMNLSLGETVFVESNKIGLFVAPSGGGHSVAAGLNKSARITFKGLTYVGAPNLLKDGVDCGSGILCNISYNRWTGILYANITSFSNYSLSTNDPVPEFSEYATILLLIIVISGFFIMRREN